MKIPAILAHPEVLGPPLERGIRYVHHFAIELVSDGKRLWAVASHEGEKVLHQIQHGLTGDEGPTVEDYVAAGYRAENYPPSGYDSRSTPEEIAAAIAAQGAAVSTEPPQNQFGTGAGLMPNQSGTAIDPSLTTTVGGNPNAGVQALDTSGESQVGNVTTTIAPGNTFS